MITRFDLAPCLGGGGLLFMMIGAFIVSGDGAAIFAAGVWMTVVSVTAK